MTDKLVMKTERFEELDLTVGQCYMDVNEYHIDIYGSVTCDGKWDSDLCLKIKANLCDEEDKIKAISSDDDHIEFIKTDYETFHIHIYREKGKGFDHIELYPHLERVVCL